MPQPQPMGLILAGGAARRMGGGDKPLSLVGGRSILDRIVERLAPQTAALLLSANGPAARFAGLSLPVIDDGALAGQGPLAGIAAGLAHIAAQHGPATEVLTVTGDCPFLPAGLAARLAAARDAAGAGAAVALSGGRRHPPILLIHAVQHREVEQALAQGRRSVEAFLATLAVAEASFDDLPVDPFMNVNAPEDLARAERLAAVLDDLHPERLLELRGLRCPLPVLKLRRALARMASREAAVAICDDPLAGIDVPAFLREAGHELVTTERGAKGFAFFVRKG